MKFADIEPQARLNILRLADAYCKATGYKLSTVSRRAHSDPRFFDLLKQKKISFTLRVHDKLISWFTKNWPPDTDVPFPIPADLTYQPKGNHYGTAPRITEQINERKDGSAEKDARPPEKGSSEGGNPGDLLRKLRGNVGKR